jgi:Tfp pilus assembly protein PilZ
MAPSTRLDIRYPSRRAVLASARAEGAILSLFVPTTERIVAGTEVTLLISIENTEHRFELQGRVRLQISEGPRAGLGVVLVGEQKRAASQMLSICAGRQNDDGAALDQRHDVDVKCLVNLHGARLPGALKDVSSTGAFIGAPRLSTLRNEAELTIQLEPLFGRWGGHLLKARVVWVGEKKGVAGFGVRFLDGTEHVRESLKKHFPSPVR